MKFLATGILILLFRVTCAQVVTHNDFKSVIPYLQNEDFKSAFEKTTQLLSATKNDSSDIRGIVTYMNIFSAAGMVTAGQMTHDEFTKNTSQYIGQRIVMPAHPCIDSTALGYNSLKFVMHNGILKGMTTTANKSKTSILCFEYFVYKEPIVPSRYIGKNVRCGGVLESIEVNPNKSNIWVSRIYIRDAFARVVTP